MDIVFNNPGGLRADITCTVYPCVMTFGMLYSVLPFGNQTVVGIMTVEDRWMMNQSAYQSTGSLQLMVSVISFISMLEVPLKNLRLGCL